MKNTISWLINTYVKLKTNLYMIQERTLYINKVKNIHIKDYYVDIYYDKYHIYLNRCDFDRIVIRTCNNTDDGISVYVEDSVNATDITILNTCVNLIYCKNISFTTLYIQSSYVDDISVSGKLFLTVKDTHIVNIRSTHNVDIDCKESSSIHRMEVLGYLTYNTSSIVGLSINYLYVAKVHMFLTESYRDYITINYLNFGGVTDVLIGETFVLQNMKVESHQINLLSKFVDYVLVNTL